MNTSDPIKLGTLIVVFAKAVSRSIASLQSGICPPPPMSFPAPLLTIMSISRETCPTDAN